MTVCLSLLKQAEEVARAHAARSVERIVVILGPLSGVEPLLLDGAFSIARKGTIAENADLVCEAGTIRVRCRACGSEGPGSLSSLACTACSSPDTTVTAGRELILKRLELGLPDEDTEAI